VALGPLNLPPDDAAPPRPDGPWDPLGRALRAFASGDEEGVLRVVADGVDADALPARYFFRTRDGLPEAETAALSLCRGRVLDVGAGAGAHALELQRRGITVTALDLSPEAVAIMKERGVRDPRRGDVFEFTDGRFDTVLMLMNGIGIVKTLRGLDRFLTHARTLLAPGVQLLADSSDLRRIEDEAVQRDLRRREERGRYFGQVRFRMIYKDTAGESFDWLFLDPERFAEHAAHGRWRFQVVYESSEGDYLARLTPLES